jgi:hypothetical protein
MTGYKMGNVYFVHILDQLFIHPSRIEAFKLASSYAFSTQLGGK